MNDRFYPIKLKFHLRSSRWDRSPQSLYNSLTNSFFDSASVILLTEVADGKRPEALRQWGKEYDYSVLQDTSPWQKGETTIVIDTNASWTVVDWATVPIGPDLGPGLPVVATIALIKHHNLGITGIVSVSHLPSAVEAIWHTKGARRVLAYRKCVVKYRKRIAQWRKEYKPDFEAISADWNINFLKPWARIYVQTMWPKHTLVRGDNKGTHGNRQIDAWLIKDAKGKIDVLEAHPSSDHHGLELTISGYWDD